jgi:tRNA(fMet)-specific endonuclease VapC
VALSVHLDTNAYTAFLRGRPEAVFVVERAPALALSPIVVGELKAGFALGSRTRENLRLLARFLDSPRVSMPAVDGQVTDAYASIYRQLRSEGSPIPTNDLWIAACASAPEQVLFTYDAHFDRIPGLRVVHDEDDLRTLLS